MKEDSSVLDYLWTEWFEWIVTTSPGIFFVACWQPAWLKHRKKLKTLNHKSGTPLDEMKSLGPCRDLRLHIQWRSLHTLRCQGSPHLAPKTKLSFVFFRTKRGEHVDCCYTPVVEQQLVLSSIRNAANIWLLFLSRRTTIWLFFLLRQARTTNDYKLQMETHGGLQVRS